ncbi:hypothetical protein ACFYTQ_36125 [Nocardia sp. NPDC004068]|uniref:hypothetical protein n=1 Tax=Nocardia sp. NPDC004068 TaxID=3364303 RepID=UPI0036D1EAC9
MLRRFPTRTTLLACALISACASPAERPPALTVAETYQRFFDGHSPTDEKIDLVENGRAFADTLRARADAPMVKGSTAIVEQVTETQSDRAEVTFTLVIDGRPALSGQRGSAVRVDGSWKVSASTFCVVLTFEGNSAPIC